MKKILVTVVLGVAALAAAQDAAKPAQSQPAAFSTYAGPAPSLRTPAEYNAYVAAIQQKDPAALISGLEAFLTQYPNSIMKAQALDNPDAAPISRLRTTPQSDGCRQARARR